MSCHLPSVGCLLATILVVPGVMAGMLDLAVRGCAPEYAIVRAAEASPSVKYAAEELRDFTERMTGVRLPIVTDEGPLPPKAIVLGCTSSQRARRPLSQCNGQDARCPSGEDSFRIVARPPHLYVEGSDVRGVLNGVYELLERYGGCRWYASWHTVVPARDAFSVPDNLDDAQTPAFLCRDVHWWDYFKGDFAARNRVNGSSNKLKERHGGNTWRFGGGLGNCHTFERLLPPEKYFDEHPEYFSMVKGVRLKERTQLCLTNPDVLRLVTSNVLARIRKDPGAKFYGVSQNDWHNWCECPACKAVDEEEGSHAGTVVRFVNAIAEAVEKEFPDKIIETLAYQYTRHVPAKTKLRHNVIPCLCSIECDFSRPLATSPCPDNVSFLKDIEDWNRQTDCLYVWDYVTDFRCYPHPFPNVYVLQENVKFFRDHGVKMLFEQGACQGRHAGFAELKGWLLAKWMWNPDLPVEPLLDDFFNGYYGKAAPIVRAVFDEAHRREAAYVGTDPSRTLKIYEDVVGKLCREVLDDDFVAWAQEQMKKAEEVAREEDAAKMAAVPVNAAKMAAPHMESRRPGGSFAYNVRMTAFSFDYIRLERLRRVALDFTGGTRSCASGRAGARPSREDEMQTLAQSLLARMDEAKDIRLSSGNVKDRHTATVRAWKAVAQERDPPAKSPVAQERDPPDHAVGGTRSCASAPPPFGTIPDSDLTILKQGEWADCRDDSAARDGRAIRISNVHYGWCVTFNMGSVTFRPGRTYTLKARVRVEKKPGASGKAFWAGVYSNDLRKGCGQITVKTDAVTSDGYVWYTVATWTPGRDEYFWIGVGQFDKKNGSAAVESVWVDEILVEEVES